jgi:serine/threonine protein kinase
MVSHPPKHANSSAHARNSQPSNNGNGTPTHAHARVHPKKGLSSSSSSNLREERPSREGHAQRAAQDVAGLKDFQLGDCLGKGAFGSVYRALNWGTGETVAIKQVRLENLGAADLKTIMLEIDLLKNLSHENIVRYNGFVKSPESLYIILEYCENGSLHTICKNFGKFPENLVALYMSQVLHGLLYLHEQGVIHRDIKGANILTTKEGLVKLADFGVATRQSGLDQSSVVGTPYWMAPEVIELSGATTASDIWSVGCTVIELIEGKPPYHKLQPMQALFRIVNDDHPPIPGSASKYLSEFLMECFQKNPNLRIDARRLLKHPWILSAKRQVSSVPTNKEAIKSVQHWNEVLSKSPNSIRRGNRMVSGPHQSPQAPSPAAAVPARKAINHLHIPKHRSIAESFRSPDMDRDDNWDDDFAESITPRDFHQPHLKPQDNFGGLFSSDRLKAYASFDALAEEATNFDNEATVKSPLNLQHLRGMSSVFSSNTPSRPASSRSRTIDSRSNSIESVIDDEYESQPKTAILRGVPKASQQPKARPAPRKRPSQMFRENTVEDYSDLMPTDEDAFVLKLRAMQNANPSSVLPKQVDIKARSGLPAELFSPRLFHPSDLKTAPKSIRGISGNGIRQRSTSSTSKRKMQRSQSEIEIQKYAEDDRDDFSDVFGDIKSSRAESDSGSEYSSMAMITSKMSSSFVSHPNVDSSQY